MEKNVGSTDKVIRWIIGLVLISMIFWVHSAWRWIGLIGFVPILTGSINYCPLYKVIGISTVKKTESESDKKQ
ncbi:MAG: YgaP family membrane protein [bacterium]